MSSIIIYQLLVAGSFLLAALSVGCSVNYPSVLLQQLSSNDSSIQLDWDTASWIGSIHGLAGVPSIIMPAFMQWQGRKVAFILACLFNIIGWIISFISTTATSILISESLLGFGSQSIMGVGMLGMSEMLSPRARNVSMGLYFVMQTLGMALAGILGSYLHWRTVALVVCVAFVIVTVVVTTTWSESPSWLAYKGEFDKCEKAFTRLRGTGDLAQTELKELILAQKEKKSLDDNKSNKQNLLKRVLQTLIRRDFYLPVIHIFIALCSLYWIGSLAILIYLSEIIKRLTGNSENVLFGNVTINVLIFAGCITSVILIRYFKSKHILLVCSSCAITCLLCVAGISYSQTTGLMSKETHMCLYFLAVFMFFVNVGTPIVVPLTAELMPVKHRGIGGPLYITLLCCLHTSVLKISPYLFIYLNLWGTLLLFAVIGFVTNSYIWFYIPETKGKTLQQLEDYYTYGDIDKHRKLDPEETIQDLIITH